MKKKQLTAAALALGMVVRGSYFLNNYGCG